MAGDTELDIHAKDDPFAYPSARRFLVNNLRSNAWLLLGVLVVMLSLVGCESIKAPTGTPEMVVPTLSPPPPAAAPKPTATADSTPSLPGTVNLWLDWDPVELETLHKVIAAFQENFPEVTFAIAYYPQDELRLAFEVAVIEGNPPSLLFGPASWGPELWKSGMVLDLTNWADDELQATIDPIAWRQVDYNGALLGLPVERQGMVLFRNRSIASSAAATLDELVDAAQRLKDDQIVGAGLDYGFMYSASQLAACDGDLFDERGDLNLNNQAGFCWLRLLMSLRATGHVSFNSEEDLILFETSRSSWLIESTLEAPRLAQVIGFDNLVIDPWPLYSETNQRLAGFVWTENVYLVTGTSPVDLEASWAFARFLLTPEGQLILSDPEGAYHLPSLASIALSDGLQAQMTASLSSGVAMPLHPDLSLYIEPLEGAVRAVTLQGATPELALEMALKKIDKALSDSGGEE